MQSCLLFVDPLDSELLHRQWNLLFVPPEQSVFPIDIFRFFEVNCNVLWLVVVVVVNQNCKRK